MNKKIKKYRKYILFIDPERVGRGKDGFVLWFRKASVSDLYEMKIVDWMFVEFFKNYRTIRRRRHALKD